jgi:hypothetical protein
MESGEKHVTSSGVVNSRDEAVTTAGFGENAVVDLAVPRRRDDPVRALEVPVAVGANLQ